MKYRQKIKKGYKIELRKVSAYCLKAIHLYQELVQCVRKGNVTGPLCESYRIPLGNLKELGPVCGASRRVDREQKNADFGLGK